MNPSLDLKSPDFRKESTQSKTSVRLRGKRKFWIINLGVVIILGVGTLAFLLPETTPTFTADVKNAANFPLYYPSKLPKDFAVDQSSFTVKDSVVTFVIKNGENKVFVTEQAKPSNIDFDKFHLQKLSGAVEKLTPIGKATVGLVAAETYAISVVTDKTWIFANTRAQLSDTQLDGIATSFTSVK